MLRDFVTIGEMKAENSFSGEPGLKKRNQFSHFA